MGSSQSAPRITEEERRRKLEEQKREEEEQQKRKREQEQLQREQQEAIKKEVDQRLKEDQEREKQRRLEEKEAKERSDEKEITCKEMEYKHLEETQKLTGINEGNERKDTLASKQVELEHNRLMKGQDEVLSIVKDTFQRAPVTNLNDVAYAAYILQCIQNKTPVDMQVLQLVASKVNNPPPLNLEHIVDKAIERAVIQGDQEEVFEDDGYMAYQQKRRHSSSAEVPVPKSRLILEQD